MFNHFQVAAKINEGIFVVTGLPGLYYLPPVEVEQKAA